MNRSYAAINAKIDRMHDTLARLRDYIDQVNTDFRVDQARREERDHDA